MRTQQNIITDSTGQQWVQDHFIYVAKLPTTLLRSTSQSISIPIEADSEFIWVKSSFAIVADLAVATTYNNTVIPTGIEVSITDSGSGRNLQNRSVSLINLAGREGLPMVNPIPRNFKPSSNINVTFTNNFTAQDFASVALSLIGFKKFRL